MVQRSAKALEQLNLVFEKCDGEVALMKAYDEWATEYEPDLGTLGYTVQAATAKTLTRYLKHIVGTAVLDVACGTGIVGEHIRKEGFKGVLHGIDGSREMIKVATQKEIYDDLFEQIMLPGKQINTVEAKRYDGVICVGAITKNHLNPKILNELLDILVPEGILAFSIIDSSYNVEVMEQVTQVLKNLEESGKIRELETVKIPSGFKIDINTNQTSKVVNLSEPRLASLYCYKKTFN